MIGKIFVLVIIFIVVFVLGINFGRIGTFDRGWVAGYDAAKGYYGLGYNHGAWEVIDRFNICLVLPKKYPNPGRYSELEWNMIQKRVCFPSAIEEYRK